MRELISNAEGIYKKDKSALSFLLRPLSTGESLPIVIPGKAGVLSTACSLKAESGEDLIFKGTMDSFRKAYKTTVLIGAAIIGSLFVYAMVIEVLRVQRGPFTGFLPFPKLQILRYLFFALALLQIGLIAFLRRMLLKKAPSDDQQALIRKLSTSFTVTSALCEAPPIYGLVLFLLGGLYWDAYLLLAYSLVLMLLHFPRYGSWEEWAK